MPGEAAGAGVRVTGRKPMLLSHRKSFPRQGCDGLCVDRCVQSVREGLLVSISSCLLSKPWKAGA